jgi:hypothetical protein
MQSRLWIDYTQSASSFPQHTVKFLEPLNPSFSVPCQHCTASSLCHILSKLLIAAYALRQHHCHVTNGTATIVHPCHHITGNYLQQVSHLLTQQVTHAQNEGVKDRTLHSLSFPSMLNSRNYVLIRNCFGNWRMFSVDTIRNWYSY